MAEIVRRDGTPAGLPGVVTVAELLSRNIPVQRATTDTDGDTPAEFVSVGSLLRREGRAPHAADRPLLPRANRYSGEGDDTQTTGRSTAARRATIAAGTLVAVGSVLGAAVFTEAASNSSAAQDGLGGSYPGHGLRDGGAPNAMATDGGDAGAGGLDAGIPAPTSWMTVAFPTRLNPGATAGSDLPGGSGGSGTPAVRAAGPWVGSPVVQGAATPAPAPGNHGNPGGGGHGSSGNEGNSGNHGNPGGGGHGADSPTGPVGSAVSGVTGAVGGAAEGVGDAAPDPVGGPVKKLGSTVSETGKGLGNTADAAVGTVQKVAEPVTEPVSEVVTGVVPAAKPVTDLLAPPRDNNGHGEASNGKDTPKPVSTTVGKGLGGVVEGAGQTVDSLAGGLLG
ncbi:hypothetical protein [Pseudonocardia asaccharolytica]|uniref:Uncharacterized protein n=1 Tax=Pseudonocardia asaccharolytica DSM 44247 = NBRC 16224 TaxID=1123024 RepID=A0A511CVD8_9PSEU|nr:hypothetical protein [Pseudonocardia asaccharolytica]GEL16213.1 hypothetical protein PA7_00500 [Pseudonocardia asaccharolytica DSM 44247 = NBRC 16224]